MNIKKMFLPGICTFIFTGILGSCVLSYKTWRNKEIQRLHSDSRIINTKQGPVEYQQMGQGPTVIFAHGTPGGYDVGIAFARLIDDPTYTFLSASRPGYLRTPLQSGKTPEEQADLYASLLDKLNIKQAAIIGISGGGPASLQFALKYPERCTALILVSAVAQSYSEEELNRNIPPLKQLFKRMYSKLSSFDPLLYALLPLAKFQPTGSATVDLLRSSAMYHLRQIGYDNDLQEFLKIGHYPLKQIGTPTLVIHGTADDEVPYADAELLHQEIPQVTLLSVPRGTHMVFYTHAQKIMPVLRDFLHAHYPGYQEQ